MTTPIVVVGAIGVLLIALSLPPLAGRAIPRRVEPFLHGLAGRPSGLLVAPSRIRSQWVIRAFGRAGLLDRTELARRLEAAGRAPDVLSFRIEQVLWGCYFFVVALVLIAFGILSGIASPGSIAVAGVAGATGALARDWYLTKEIARRRATLRAELPTAIDHMTLALLAGDSVPGAFARVASITRGVVAEEFGGVAANMRGGATIVDSLDAFRDRLPDPAVARFVDAICTAVERGTSLAEVLRAQADDVRDARARHLMELGGRREIWMLIPVVFLIMPVVVLFALYPGLVSLDLLVR